MKILEKDLICVVEEVERLQTEVLNAEKRASGNFLSIHEIFVGCLLHLVRFTYQTTYHLDHKINVATIISHWDELDSM